MSANLQAMELALVSTLIDTKGDMNNEKYTYILNSLQIDFFNKENARILLDAINFFYGINRVFDEMVIYEYLVSKNIAKEKIEEIIIEATNSLPIASLKIIDQYVLALRENFNKKYLLNLSHLIMEKTNKNESAEKILATISKSVEDLNLNTDKKKVTTLMKVREERKKVGKVNRIATEIPFIDTVLTDRHGNKGFRNEGLVFISGLKQSGKTFVLTRIIENVSKSHPVLFGSLEFGKYLYDENIQQQEEDGHFVGNIDNIFVFDDIYDISQIISEIKFQVQTRGIKLVAIDSMMRMTNNNPELKTDESKISNMFSRLGKLSKELKVPIIVIVQSSKEDLKSSIVSVKGSMNADHEAYVWFHLRKLDIKNMSDERRVVMWNKNKDTMKHPLQHLMFVPQTADFYRYEADKDGSVGKALDEYRKPVEKIEIDKSSKFEVVDFDIPIT
jgi:replicative DNA helicase